jgi:hypothetical protein
MAVWRSYSSRKPAPRTTFIENIFGHFLDPIDWLVETIFAILVLLTFTLAFAFFELNANPDTPVTAENVHQLVIGILGTTIGWGLINGTLYALTSVFARGEKHRILTNLQRSETRDEGLAVIAYELDHILEPITQHEKRQMLDGEIVDYLIDSQPQPVKLTREDLAGALGCVLVSLLAVLPAIVPLVILDDNYDLAIRLSNFIAFTVLFYSGYQWGKYSGTNPWKTGLLLLCIGVLLVMIAIPLGG